MEWSAKGNDGAVSQAHLYTAAMRLPEAAKYATDCGIDMVIASGEDVKVLYKILDGEEIGTVFLSDSKE